MQHQSRTLEVALRKAISDYYHELYTSDLRTHSLSYSRGTSGLLHFALWAESNVVSFTGQPLSSIVYSCIEDGLSERQESIGLFPGLPGIVFSLDVYERVRGTPIAGLQKVRDLLGHAVISGALDASLHSQFDLIGGTAGLIVYFSMLSFQESPAVVQKLLSVLDETAGELNGQRVWWNDDKKRTADANAVPEVDLGLAHGLPGVMAALFASGAAGGKRRLDEAAQVLNLVLSTRTGGGIPYRLAGVGPSRVAWCYGSLGMILAALVQPPSIMSESTRLALNELVREVELRVTSDQHGMQDGFFCHGASGVAIILQEAKRCGLSVSESSLNYANELAGVSVLRAVAAPHEFRRNNRYAVLDGLPGGLIAALCALNDELAIGPIFAPMLLPSSLRAVNDLRTRVP